MGDVWIECDEAGVDGIRALFSAIDSVEFPSKIREPFKSFRRRHNDDLRD
jgi:hypothetical protein